ncbi:MAG: NAD-dependent epimerase/dehydratase family protein [Gemmataceae bacterium]
MKALVTGGGGFLGSAIVRRLIARGDNVRSFSRQRYPELEKLGVEQFSGDLADAGAVDGAVAGCDIVFHVAAKAGIWGPYREFRDANIIGTRNMIAACRKNHITRLVYTSSPSVVHTGQDLEGVNESVPIPRHFEAHYPATKAIAERKLLAANAPELATMALRPHLIWGPGDVHLVPRLIERAKQGKVRFIGDGSKLVDVTYIDNAVDAHVNAADRLWPGSPIAGKAYFISQGEPVRMADFINRILAAAGLPPLKKSLPFPTAYGLAWLIEFAATAAGWKDEPRLTRFVVRQFATAHWFDISAARRDLDYTPKVSTEEGLRRLEAWLNAK